MKFTPLTPARLWTGRYSRIPGREPAFHISALGLITVKWTDHIEDEQLTAPIQPSPDATAMAKAINDIKIKHAGQAGGSFLINEYGQVISPIAGSRDRYLVGEIEGIPQFINPQNGEFISLAPPNTATPGLIWSGPYIGMKFNLSYDDRIYFNHEDGDTINKICLNTASDHLIRALRIVRPAGGIRFIVNLHGAVFTKTQDNLGNWIPVFVTYIDLSKWFPRES